MPRTDMQDDLDPRCVWMVSDSDAAPDEERRCMRPAKWMYIKKRTAAHKLPWVERYTMCGKHASEANRERAHQMGYVVTNLSGEKADAVEIP